MDQLWVKNLNLNYSSYKYKLVYFFKESLTELGLKPHFRAFLKLIQNAVDLDFDHSIFFFVLASDKYN